MSARTSLVACPSCRTTRKALYEHLGRSAECPCGTRFVLKEWACSECRQVLRDSELRKCPRCHAAIEQGNAAESEIPSANLSTQSEMEVVFGADNSQSDDVDKLLEEWNEEQNPVRRGNEGTEAGTEQETDQSQCCNSCGEHLIAKLTFCHHCGASQIKPPPGTQTGSTPSRSNKAALPIKEDDTLDNAADERDDWRSRETAAYEREQELIAQKQLISQNEQQLTAQKQLISENRAKAESQSLASPMSSSSQSTPKRHSGSKHTRLFVGIGGVVAFAFAFVAFSGDKNDKQDAIVQSEDSQNGAATASVDHSASPPVQRLNTQTAPAEKPEVNTELFEKAIRAAMVFSPSTTNTAATTPLSKELRFIKPGLKSNADKELFELLEKMEVVQQDIQKLSVVTALSATNWKKMQNTAQTTWFKVKSIKEATDNDPGFRKFRFAMLSPQEIAQVKNYHLPKKLYEVSTVAVEIISQGGMIIGVETGNTVFDNNYLALMKKGKIREIAEKYNIKISTRDGVTFFPSTNLLATLKAINESFADAANQMRFGN